MAAALVLAQLRAQLAAAAPADPAGRLSSRQSAGQGHYLFGGLAASRAGSLQIARSSRGGMAGHGREAAAGLFQGGLSGVAFGPDVGIVSRVTQGVRAGSVTG